MKLKLSYENIYLRNFVFLGILFILALFGEDQEGDYIPTPLAFISIFLGVYFSVFFNNIVLIKQLLLKEKYKEFFRGFFLFWTFYTIVSLVINKNQGIHFTILNEIISTFSISLIGSGVYFIHLWIMQNVIQTRKKLLNTETELSFLKQQLNPHFLLNAMNNLYGEALTAPETIPERILILSELLRYQIEATKKEHVTIMEEMDFIAKYIDYHQYKSNNLSYLSHTIGDYESLIIPPLFFVPLVENAAKFSSEAENPYIDIIWNFHNNDLIFTIKNNYLEGESRLKGTAVGLENLRRRLEVSLIKHKLTISKAEKGVFNLELRLWDLPTNV
ncbi:sensor histidine kinase [Flavobacterium sp. '19STA2R22 D10 B1']|uniref:sensor histidine kinase n=1 Tax=Flavobacterium aerium TaxID=3037261 RepID=UPI00278C382F|nr:histidine kinase [Flavobacterium sp. '19STA2R22 D10 B1']